MVCCYLLPGFGFFWGLYKINIPPLTLGTLEIFFFSSNKKLYFLFKGEFDNFKRVALLVEGCTKIMFKSDQF